MSENAEENSGLFLQAQLEQGLDGLGDGEHGL